MIVIGLDGATWDVIKPNIGSLPAFGELLGRYKHSVLECDVRPVHSAPSWTTIFSGLTPEQHGVRDFVMDRAARDELLSRKIFIWQKVRRAIVMGVPIALPPLNHNYELRDWESVVLAVKEEEMFRGTKKLLGDTIAAIEYGGANLVAVVFSEPDRAQHIFWGDNLALLEHYKSVDAALGKLMPYFAKEDFLILSDHGFTDAQETKRMGWDNVRENQAGGHHPAGIAISNREPPRKVSEVFGFMMGAMEGGGDG
ncbi:MAG: alkaline phosphatase family protein [Candidatus Micrarchaeota archaeon]